MKKSVKCKLCDGRGWSYDHYQSKMQCEDCHGTGKLPNVPKKSQMSLKEAKCPTCGATCEIGGLHTHYYIPKACNKEDCIHICRDRICDKADKK
jgi:DnaJ-class molecular chaperone